MTLSTILIIEIILLIIVTLSLIILLMCLFRAMLIRNKDIRILQFDNQNQDLIDQYKEKLMKLIEIKTSSFDNQEDFHDFREKLKEEFPNIHKFFNKEKIDNNAIFTYKNHIKGAPNILFATHIDCKNGCEEPHFENGDIYGNGTFDAKSLLFSIFQAIETTLIENQKVDVNLTIVMTTDDETTKKGAQSIANNFLKKGKFFDLVIEEGSGIVDPIYLGLKSHYALIGIGVTGEAKVRFKTKKATRGKARLKEFIRSVEEASIFKARIDNLSMLPIKEIAKDMTFCERFFFNNLTFFRTIVKKKIDEEYIGLAKIIKIQTLYGDILENDKEVYTDVVFEHATHSTTADILIDLANNMEKFEIEYDIISNKDSSKVTSVDTQGYKIVNKAIEKVFQDLYTAPIIITKISEKRYFDKVSDCVIRFSPLYYSNKAIKDAHSYREHIPAKSLYYGVKFFEEIIKTYKRRL